MNVEYTFGFATSNLGILGFLHRYAALRVATEVFGIAVRERLSSLITSDALQPFVGVSGPAQRQHFLSTQREFRGGNCRCGISMKAFS